MSEEIRRTKSRGPLEFPLPSTNFFHAAPSDTAPLSRPAVLIAGTVTILITGYATGYLLRPNGGWDQALHSFQVSGTIAPTSPIYVIAAGLALLLFITLLKSSNLALWGRNPLAGRPEKPIAEFVREAKGLRISLRVAREAYHLLQHHYPRPMCIDWNDNLRRDLRMTPGNIISLRSGLLGRTDRVEQDARDLENTLTVRDLLEHVESAPRNGVDRAKMRQRASDMPFAPRPAVENLEFTESSSLSDPDFLRRAHFKWLRRRTSDYKGFRSRENDQLTGEEHAGPFRRGTELSRRLAVKREAGRLAKIAAEARAEDETRCESSWTPSTHQDQTSSPTVYHGY